MRVPKCLENDNKLCAKHLEEEVQHHFKHGAKAVTMLSGRIIHINGLQLLGPQVEFTEGCSDDV